MTVFAALLAAIGLTGATPQASQPSLDIVLDSLEQVRNFRTAAISPDGTQVAWVQRIRDRQGIERLSAIDVADLTSRSSVSRRITAAADGRAHREHSPAWSPEGQRLAFLSDGLKEGQLQLYLAPLSGGPARRLTKLTGQLADPKWSPDGKTLAFLFISGSSQEPGALVPYKPDAGVVEQETSEQRIATVDLKTGRVLEVSPANLYVYEYDWSPDGLSFAASAAEGSGTNNYWIAQLYTVRTNSGQTRSIWKPPLQVAHPRWSPDGKSIACIHGLMSDFGSKGGDIYSVPLEAGEPKNLTPGMKASASSLAWRPSGEILFTEHVAGEFGIAAVDPSIGKITTLWTGPEVLGSLSVSRDGTRSAAVRHDFLHPPEIWAGPIGAWNRMTDVNRHTSRFWGEPNQVSWESDRAPVSGWLLPPKNLDPSRRYPMIVSVHGGPAAAHTPGWPSRWNAVLPSQGYFVFLPNPRGSFGQGEAFAQGNVKDLGFGDLRDILKGIDAVSKIAPIDQDRIGIAGWSYGGYMTMWAVTQTGRFKAAVAGAGISNWQSYYGQNRIDRWMIPYFGTSVYDDPEIYVRSSPMTFIKRVKTPTLVLHGDRDSEVPTPQGYEFWHALRTLGVPTQLVIYENEGHAITKPEHQRDIEKRLVAWFDKYLKAS